MATDPWAGFEEVAPATASAPAFPAVVRGRGDPYKQAAEARADQDQAFQAEDQTFKREDQAIQREKNILERRKLEREQGELKDAQAKAAGFLQRAVAANADFDKAGIGPRGLAGEFAEGVAPTIVNRFDSPERQLAEQAERNFIAAVLRLESGAAISPQEFQSQSLIYFPQPGDSEQVMEQKARARKSALEQLRLQAGPGATITADEDRVVPDPNPDEPGLEVNVTYEGPSPDAERIAAQRSQGQRDTFGAVGGFLDDAATLGKQGITLGLADEAAGVGGAIAALLTNQSAVDGYVNNRDAERLRVEGARDRLGWGGTALELAGGGAGVLSRAGSVIGAGRKAAAAGNLTREGVQGQLVRQATAGGAGVGAVGGFGYGEGAQGSAANALLGAGGGAALGFAGQRVGNALANRVGGPKVDPARAQQVAAAGNAEGVTVNRAMVDPRQANTFSGAEATRFGGPRINRAMDEVEGQIEGRVNALGGGSQPLDKTAVGDKVQRAGERFITSSAKTTSEKYKQAEKMAGDAMVRPVRAKAVVDEMARKLSETANTNKAEIGFLQGLSEDLSKPLSISALRDMRTTLRKKISKGELVFGQNEARVLAIMDEAAQDIRTGLTQQGKAMAADAFSAADTAYAARMDYIQGTVQKLIGKRGANMSAEQVASKFESMARNDAEGLRKFWVALDPSERGDMRATFAEALGRNNKGEFSPAILLNNIGGNNRKMSERAIRTVFGNDGAESVKNLKVLAEEVNRLNGMRNSSNTGRVNNWRSWLFEVAMGGGGAGLLGGMSGGLGAGAVAAAAGGAVTAGAKATRDILTARMLTSPKIQRWLAQAPKTASPKAIDNHFNRLGDIAKAEPALAGDIDVFRKAIFGAANDNAAARPLAAEDQDAEKR